MEKILITYYENNAKKLHKTVDKILSKFGGLSNKDLDDFYSLANEVFVDVMRRYDNSQSFDAFLYSCLFKKLKTEMTKRNREKRRVDKISISIDTPIGDEENSTIKDIIADDFTVEKVVFEEKEYSKRMLSYLGRLSEMQREVLRLDIAGYLPNEIREALQISKEQYMDCYAAIRSYRNASVLF